MSKYKLFHGDCLTILPKIPDKKIKCLCCDPSNYTKNNKPFINFISRVLPKITDNGCGFIFTHWTIQQVFIDELKRCKTSVKNIVIWNKGVQTITNSNSSFTSQYESIIFFANKDFKFTNGKPCDIIGVSNINSPNEKSVRLIEILLSYVTDSNDWVLDCFMKSGGTGVACMKLNRKFCGIERDKEYFDVASKRIQEAKKEKDNLNWLM